MRGCTCRGLTLCPQCTALAARAGVIPPLLDSAVQLSEKAFQSAIVRLAKSQGWDVYFTYRSKRSPEGFPDLVLAHAPTATAPGGRMVLAELETADGALSQAQAHWIAVLQSIHGIECYLWRPGDMPAIVARLSR